MKVWATVLFKRATVLKSCQDRTGCFRKRATVLFSREDFIVNICTYPVVEALLNLPGSGTNLRNVHDGPDQRDDGTAKYVRL